MGGVKISKRTSLYRSGMTRWYGKNYYQDKENLGPSSIG